MFVRIWYSITRETDNFLVIDGHADHNGGGTVHWPHVAVISEWRSANPVMSLQEALGFDSVRQIMELVEEYRQNALDGAPAQLRLFS